MQSRRVDNHPEIQNAPAKIIFLAHFMLLLHSSTSYSFSISSAISCSPSLSKPFTACSCPPPPLIISSLMSESQCCPHITAWWWEPLLLTCFIFTYLYFFITQKPLYFLLCCFSHLGGVLHKNQWNEIVNLLKGTSLFQQSLSASGNMVLNINCVLCYN